MTGVIVHEWIEKSGGAEKVVDAMAGTFPDADIMCLWSDAPDRYTGHRVIESPLAHTSLRRHKALALPVLPELWRHCPGRNYDWALVSSHLFAHQARFPQQPDLKKFVYVHTPARYLWAPELDPRGSGALVKSVAPIFRAIDRRRARGEDSLAANSKFVADRIQYAWGQEARVIYPPVDVERIQRVEDWTSMVRGSEQEVLDTLPETFLLGASRFVSYKRLDLVIRFADQAGMPVVLAGGGPEEGRLREIAAGASVPVRFVVGPSSALLYALYQRALAYVFPPIEDFGIMPVEAMAAGTPVIANTVGGAAESVDSGTSGVHIDFSVMERGNAHHVVHDAMDGLGLVTAEACQKRARSFDAAEFASAIRGWIGSGATSTSWGGTSAEAIDVSGVVRN